MKTTIDNLSPFQVDGVAKRYYHPVIGNNAVEINAAIKGDRYRKIGEYIFGPLLMVRAELPPHYCFPYCLGSVVQFINGTTITVADELEAAHFRYGDTVTYFDYIEGTGMNRDFTRPGSFVTYTAKVIGVNDLSKQITLDQELPDLEINDLLFVYSTPSDGIVGPKLDNTVANMNTVIYGGEIFISNWQTLPIKVYISGTFVEKYIYRIKYIIDTLGQIVLEQKFLYNKSNPHLKFV